MLNTLGEYFVILATIGLIGFIKVLLTLEPPSIFNVYRTPSSLYWIKTTIIFIALSIQKAINVIKPASAAFDKFEKAQTVASHKKPLDSIYLSGSNADGDRIIIYMDTKSGTEADAYMFLKVASSAIGILEHPKNSTTTLINNNEEFFVENVKMTAVVPMKKWKITYEGKMRKTDDPTKVFSIQIHFKYTSEIPFFDSVMDLDTLLSAKAVALETWNLEFFNLLFMKDRVHYGQFGELQGRIIIDGKGYELNMNAFRYRNFETEWNWAVYHRSIMHILTAENGDRFIIGKESVPITLSNLTYGFVYCASEKKTYPLQNCNFELYQHGEDEELPMDYAFLCEAGNRRYAVQIKIEQSAVSYVDNNWECKMIERICNADINGKRAWGTCQWLYRNVYGKNVLNMS